MYSLYYFKDTGELAETDKPVCFIGPAIGAEIKHNGFDYEDEYVTEHSHLYDTVREAVIASQEYGMIPEFAELSNEELQEAVDALNECKPKKTNPFTIKDMAIVDTKNVTFEINPGSLEVFRCDVCVYRIEGATDDYSDDYFIFAKRFYGTSNFAEDIPDPIEETIEASESEAEKEDTDDKDYGEE